MSDETKQHILIVDDIAENIKILMELLKSDYSTYFARNGKAALDIAMSKKPDLILLDIVMPDMDGYEICRKLKESPETRDIPVIFITVMSEVENENRGFDVGAVDYIAKPFVSSIVKSRIKTHLELKRQRDDLENLTRHLDQLNRTKNKLLGMAAHDLRNPLSAIRVFSQMLMEPAELLEPAERLEYSVIIFNLSNEMLALVNDLLDIAVIESGKLEIHPEPWNLGELIQDKIRLMRPVAAQKNMHIEADIRDVPPVEFDRKRIAQVFDNLCGNAIKFSPPGSTIFIRALDEDEMVRVDIADKGPGIAAPDQEKMFGAFHKGAARPTGDEPSTGLGLAIVKKIIEAHQGKVAVNSVLGEGATMSFLLPKK